MRRTFLWSVLSLAGVVLGAAAAWADVVVRGPFGGTIVVPAPVEVRIGPTIYVGPSKMPAPLGRAVPDGETLPPPRVLVPGPAGPVSAILPRDFAKTFKPTPGTHEVTFLHPVSKKPVMVAFVLPEGQPRVSCIGNSLLFDYDQHEVEIRFKIGGKVVVSSR